MPEVETSSDTEHKTTDKSKTEEPESIIEKIIEKTKESEEKFKKEVEELDKKALEDPKVANEAVRAKQAIESHVEARRIMSIKMRVHMGSLSKYHHIFALSRHLTELYGMYSDITTLRIASEKAAVTVTEKSLIIHKLIQTMISIVNLAVMQYPKSKVKRMEIIELLGDADLDALKSSILSELKRFYQGFYRVAIKAKDAHHVEEKINQMDLTIYYTLLSTAETYVSYANGSSSVYKEKKYLLLPIFLYKLKEAMDIHIHDIDVKEKKEPELA